MIHTLKQSAVSLLNGAGISRWVGSSGWRRKRLLILCYHGVSEGDEHEWDPDLYVSAAHFAGRLAVLQRHRCTVLSLGEGLQRLYAGRLPDRAVSITFDDGYSDFMRLAAPLLQRYGYPATVYLTTHRVDHPLPNPHLFVSYVLWTAQNRLLDGNGILNLEGQYRLDSPDGRQRVLDRLTEARVGWPEAALDAAAKQIVERLGLDYGALLQRRLLTLLRCDEVAQLAAAGVDFQLHTHLHRTPEDGDEFIRDVLLNRRRIEEITGARAEHLCYPSSNYRPVYPPLMRRHGIVSGTTCDPGMATAAADPFRLPRFVDTSRVSTALFEGWITGAALCLPRRTRHALSEPFEELPLRPEVAERLRTAEAEPHPIATGPVR